MNGGRTKSGLERVIHIKEAYLSEKDKLCAVYSGSFTREEKDAWENDTKRKTDSL